MAWFAANVINRRVLAQSAAGTRVRASPNWTAEFVSIVSISSNTNGTSKEFQYAMTPTLSKIRRGRACARLKGLRLRTEAAGGPTKGLSSRRRCFLLDCLFTD